MLRLMSSNSRRTFRNNGKVRTFEALGIFAEASVPVLSGIDCLIRVAAQGLKNALSVGLGSEGAQTHIGGVVHWDHQRDIIGADADNIEFARDAADILAVDALYFAHALGRINHEIVRCEPLFHHASHGDAVAQGCSTT